MGSRSGDAPKLDEDGRVHVDALRVGTRSRLSLILVARLSPRARVLRHGAVAAVRVVLLLHRLLTVPALVLSRPSPTWGCTISGLGRLRHFRLPIGILGDPKIRTQLVTTVVKLVDAVLNELEVDLVAGGRKAPV